MLTIFAGFFVSVIAIVIAGWMVHDMPSSLAGDRQIILWSGGLGGMMLAGMVAGWLGKRVVTWEGVVFVAGSTALAWVHLAQGWHVILENTLDAWIADPNTSASVVHFAESILARIRKSEEQIYLEFVARIPLGVRIFGEMWERFISIAAFLGVLLAILGSSFSFLFFGNERRLDGRFRFEWTIAWRHLGGSSKRVGTTAIVATAGIALGVAALVAVTAVMSGYQQDVQNKILSTNAHLIVQKYGIDFVEHEEIASKGLAVEGVEAATPFAFNTAMLSGGDMGLGVLLKGIVPETAGTVTAIDRNVCKPVEPSERCTHVDPETATDNLVSNLRQEKGQLPRLILGHSLFRKLKLPIGSEVVLTTAVGIAGARGNAPKRMGFRIGGSFQSGMHEFDSRLIYMQMGSAQKLMGLGKAANGVEFRITNPDEVTDVSKKVLSAVGRYPYRTLDWHDLNSGIFTALKLQKIVMFLVLCSIVIVAAFNIASTLFMAAAEKAHEIGVLKSMGASDASIMKIFVIEGWVVGLAGTAIGVISGLLICAGLGQLHLNIAADVYMVSSLEVQVNGLEILATVVSALAISHLATLYPALSAARRAPVDAMRYV